MTTQLALSFIAALFIGGIAGFLGSLLITKRMALVAGPLGHLALPGAALALIYGLDIFWGSLATIVLGAFAIWLFSLASKLPLEALTAVVFAFMIALGFLILPLAQAEQALIGDITQVNLFDALLAVVLSTAIFVLIKKIYPKLVLAGISEDLARSENINVGRYNLIYLGAIALVVAMEVKIVGVLLTAALMAIPAAAASNISRSLGQYTLWSLVLGGASAVLGLLLFLATGLPAGPLIITISTLLFLALLLFKKKP